MRRASTTTTTLLALLLTAPVLSCSGRNQAASFPAVIAQAASVTIERPGGVALTQHLQGGAVFIAGQEGERYNIRITNNSPARIEAVVTVDGRDVITGEPGDYRRQRGHVVGPRSSVVIEGFRQSFDHVAAFRFSSVQASYSARQGTPQNVGVIGVAVFYEKPPKRPRTSKPIAVGPAPAPEPEPTPGAFADDRVDESARAPAAAPSEGGGAGESFDAEADMDGAPAGAPATLEAEEAAPEPASAKASKGRDFAPPPAPQNELGTEYGETMSSKVHEVEFRRQRKREPDELYAIYYDSARGLQNRGIQVSAQPAPLSGAATTGGALSGTPLD